MLLTRNTLVVAVSLATTLVVTACGGGVTASDVPSSGYNVKYEFHDAVKSNVLSERENLFIWWSATQSLWTIRATEYDRQWLISVPNEDSVEVWEFNDPRLAGPYVIPRNSGALLTAITLFCIDRSNPLPACQSYFRTLDALVESLDR